MICSRSNALPWCDVDMCGVAGRIGKSRLPVSKIRSATQTMLHRGPDGFQFHSEKFGSEDLTLFFSRLAIIDLDVRSMQPFEFDDSCLVFNGEIYNYREVRRSLVKLGHQFNTEGDAEVLIHSLRQWGIDALQALEGMWAFIWLDRRAQQVWVSRDRFGEKPLFWVRNPDEIVFASEVATLQAISARPLITNYQQVRRYLVNGYKSLNKTLETFHEDVYKLEPGTWMQIDTDKSIKTGRYWKLASNPDPEMKFYDAVRGVRTRLEAAVQATLQADVPVAFSLSGGVDSNALAFLAEQLTGKSVNAFTIQTADGRYDESASVKKIVEQSEFVHQFIKISPERGLDKLRKEVTKRSAPVSTISYFLQSILYEAMAKRGIKVSISGTAADEVFSGYFDHHLLYFASIQSDSNLLSESIQNWSRHIRPHVRNPFLGNSKLFINSPEFRDHIYLEAATFTQALTSPWSEEFYETAYCEDLLRNRMMNELFHEATPVILHEDDMNAMSASVENRSPYLDRQLVEYAFTIPTPLLINNGYAKAVLRSAVADIVPESVVLEHKKTGFNATLTDVFDFEDSELKTEILSDGEIYSIVSKDAVASLLDNRTLQNSSSKFLFNVINAKLFLEQQ